MAELRYKFCPKCGSVNSATAARCSCGTGLEGEAKQGGTSGRGPIVMVAIGLAVIALGYLAYSWTSAPPRFEVAPATLEPVPTRPEPRRPEVAPPTEGPDLIEPTIRPTAPPIATRRPAPRPTIRPRSESPPRDAPAPRPPEEPRRPPPPPRERPGDGSRVQTWEVVRNADVYVRPDESSARVSGIGRGAVVDVVGRRNGWLEIRSRTGRPPGFLRERDARLLR